MKRFEAGPDGTCTVLRKTNRHNFAQLNLRQFRDVVTQDYREYLPVSRNDAKRF